MSDLDILVRVEAKVDVLNERMDRHEMKNDARFTQVFNKLDNAANKVHQVELDGVREDGSIKVKIAGLSAMVSLLMTAIIESAKSFFSNK